MHKETIVVQYTVEVRTTIVSTIDVFMLCVTIALYRYRAALNTSPVTVCWQFHDKFAKVANLTVTCQNLTVTCQVFDATTITVWLSSYFDNNPQVR